MADKPELVKVEALEAFTITRPYGQFHGDPDSEDNRLCKVPVDALNDLLNRGKVALIEASKGTGPADNSEQVKEGAGASEFTSRHVGGGWYEISGPGLDEPEKAQGKDEAAARIAELEADSPDASSDAPPA